MKRNLLIYALCLLWAGSYAQVHTNDNLWFNNGAEVFVGTGALVTVQGDVTNNQATVTGITHLTNNGFVWVQGNMYGDNAFKQAGTGSVRLQNKTALYTAPYATENYQVIQGGYRVNGNQSAISAIDDGSFFNLELDNQNGLVFIKNDADVRGSVDFAPVSITIDGTPIAPNGTTNRLLTYDPGTNPTPAAAPVNGASYTATFGMMNNAAGLTNFKHVSTNLQANTTVVDNAYVQGKLRRAIEPVSGGSYGFPIGLQPDASGTESNGIQYAVLDFTGNAYNVLNGHFQKRSDNTDPSPNMVCSIAGGFVYYGASNHGEWVFTAGTAASEAYNLTIYPQDYGTVNSRVYFITKDNDLPTPGTQSCGNLPDGISVSGLTGFSEFAFAGGLMVLPVNLMSFTYTTNQCNALLKWITATEKNVSHFEVEGSLNGTDWTMLFIVAAEGNSTSEKSYSQAVGLQSGVANLFRLKTVDIDGKFSYSPVKNISCNSKPSIFVYPNPVKETLTIQNLPNGTKYIVLNSMTGAEVARKITTLNQSTLSLGHLPKGLYLLRVISDQGAVLQTGKIIK